MSDTKKVDEVARENLTISLIHERYMTKRRDNIYIALEDLDFIWSRKEVRQFDCMWEQGLGVHDIAKVLGRDPDEVFILAMDRVRKGAISKRPGGIYGMRAVM